MYDDKTLTRFWAKVDKSDGCWLWTGCVGKRDNRPIFYLNERQKGVDARRVAYEISGGTLQPLSWLDKCPLNELCVNPAHLREHQRYEYQPRLKSFAERFWQRVDQSGDCWLWRSNVAGIEGHIYGRFHNGKKLEYAQRIAWTLSNGAIPQGQLVIRRCKTQLCVNPAHHYLGDLVENVRQRERMKLQRAA